MLPTESLGWNGLQALKSRLCGRLSRFARDNSIAGRPDKSQNDAAFFEADLRCIIMTTPAVVDISDDEYYAMDQTAQRLLESLNDMVNGDLVDPLESPVDQGLKSFESDLPQHILGASYDVTMFGDRYPRLRSLIVFLENSAGQFTLTTRPGPWLFTISQGHAGRIAIDRVAKWKTFLQRFATGREKSWNPQVMPLLPRNETLPKESAQEQPGTHQKWASIVVNAIFKNFQEHNCGRTHEIRLRVSDDWQIYPGQPTLDMFVSCCPDREAWQQAKCGAFQIRIDDVEKDSICAAIQRAREKSRKLYLFVDQQGLVDISDKMPPVLASLGTFTMESLSDLLDRKAFNRITPRDYLEGTTVDKFGSRDKAVLALALARSLMDFFDEGFELALYSWQPECVYFVRSSDAHTGDRVLYISLKPRLSGSEPSDLLRTVEPGNPVLLSFARLLLEIENGEKIPMEVHSESKYNLPKWAQMCAFVNMVEREASGSYLQAVEGCLYLHMALSRYTSEAAGAAAGDILRKAIYERIVRNLELTVNPQITKRNRRANGRPTTRDGFEIAIVCAMPLEFNAVSLLFDEIWDDDYGRIDRDPNVYTTGRIGKFNVVLVRLLNMGKVSAAGTSAYLSLSYPSLNLVLVTGVCGGVPHPNGDEELLLGDVVISKHIVQYDLGRQYPDEFLTRDTVQDSLGPPPKDIRNLLAIFETNLARDRLKQRTAIFLEQIQINAARRRRGAKYQYPGASHDKLFQPSYRHKYHISRHSHYTESYKTMSCDEMGCDKTYLVRRERIEEKLQLEKEGRNRQAEAPWIFIGSIGSGDTVMKSAEDRDRISESHGVIAFEMEGAGVWDVTPCIVVKGVCDYADSHKNKTWQDFAAATAAAATKALLEQYVQRGKSRRSG
ncbi:hypothetical protein FQN50_008373 [Emmonsiellopsis sp. PD_5]|nr:hypothetical protein FQN50_008373 [Emmonsiellopsis sp. PD_5]